MHFSRLLKASPHCLPSPNGNLIATLLPSSIKIYSVRSLQSVHAITLPQDLGGPVWAFTWSPSSRKLLVAAPDQIHVFSALDDDFHAVIRNPVPGTTRPSHVRFGSSDGEVYVWAAFGLKLAVFDLATSKAVEISNPKFHQAAAATRGVSFRPSTSHMALMTRAAGKDAISIHHPITREVQRSWQPDVIDAQGLAWSLDGRWLVVWESSTQGPKVLFYTPDGNLYRVWIGRRGSTADDAETELGAGVKFCQLSPDANQAALGDHSRCICILDMKTVTETKRLHHPLTVGPKDTLQIWQEQLSVSPTGSFAHTFVRATQTVYPPTRPTNSSTADARSGCLSAVFDSSSSLLAVRLEDCPGTVWVWDVPAAELRSVLIFHANATNVSWHPSIRELLMVACDGENYGGVVFVWDPLSNGPRAVDFRDLLPSRKLVGRSEALWLPAESDSAALFFRDGKHCLLAALASPDQSPPPWLEAAGDDWTVGNSTNEAADGEGVLLLAADEDASQLDDTFSFLRP